MVYIGWNSYDMIWIKSKFSLDLIYINYAKACIWFKALSEGVEICFGFRDREAYGANL